MSLPQPGDRVRIAFTKWGGGRHWTGAGVWLGEDEHGRWVGWPDGTVWERPGRTFTSDGEQVGLFPRDRGFAATFYEPVGALEWRVYLDVTTVPEVTAQGVVTAVDLDLDVIQRFDGTSFVDDEDEFALHRVRHEYPDWLVAHAQAECSRLVADVRSGAPYLDEALATHWRGRLAHLVAGGRTAGNRMWTPPQGPHPVCPPLP